MRTALMPDVLVPAFTPFYRHLVSRDRIDEALRGPVTGTTAPEHVEEVLDSVWEALVDTVEEHSFRVLISAFHSFREREEFPMSTEDDTALRLFEDRLADESESLLQAHPVLRDRLTTVLGNSLDSYTDLFSSYARDLPLLREHGLVGSEGRIKRIFATGSDLHNDNRQVFGVRLVDDERLVFKPRALTADDFVRDLYRTADRHLKHSLLGCVPRSVTVGDHGWQEFVVPEPMTSPDQPARYYYRFGALCALLGAIGSTDLHDENLLAHGETPCVLDTETMTRPNPDVGEDNLTNTLNNQLKLSVAATMLVPTKNPGSPIDILMTAVGIEGEQTSQLKRPVIAHGRADAVRVSWEQVRYTHRDNLPRLGERTLTATDHYGHIIEGYVDALGAVRGGELEAVLDRHPMLPVRVLLRSTMVYSRFKDAANHPRYLASAEETERVLRLLGHYPKHLSEEGTEYVRREEFHSLNTGNIPYFMTRGDSRALATPVSSLPDAYGTSPLDFSRLGLRMNAERSDLYHRFVMEECFGEVTGEDAPAGLWEHSVFRNDGPVEPGSWWPGITDRIDRIGVTFQGAKGPETGWLCGAGPDRAAFTINPGHLVSFHDTGGTVSFLRSAARTDPRWRQAHEAAERGLDVLVDTFGPLLDSVPESMFTGTASLLMVRPELVDDPAWLSALLERVNARAEAGTLENDLVSGPGGLLMALLSRPEGTVPPQVLNRLRDLLVPQVALERDRPWFDLAHGELGLRWAAARAGGGLGEDDLVLESADWLRARLATGEYSPVAGWCNGTSGLLLAAAEIARTADRREWLVDEHLEDLVRRATHLGEGPLDLSVCHGTSGVVQSLLAAAHLLELPSLTERAHEYQRSVLTRIHEEGFYTGAPGRTSLLGYMLGWSGVADTDLLLHAHEGAARLPIALIP
ncbi:type 2 lanthipeptide synthetase LanM [Nocardiopsis terrae]